MHAAPEPGFSVVGCLNAENSLVPVGVVGEANVFDSKLGLPLFPFRRPGQMRLVELLSQFRNFDLVGIREKNPKQHAALASLSSCQCSECRDRVELSRAQIDEGSGALAPNPSFSARRVFFENAFA